MARSLRLGDCVGSCSGAGVGGDAAGREGGRRRGFATVVDRLERSAPRWTTASHPPRAPIRFQSGFTREEYLRAVQRVREFILAGDIFQANLSQRFEAPWPGDSFDFYRRLTEVNPAPFAAYFRGDGFAVASASPERFLMVDPTGHVETRPIKGTRSRGATADEDRRLAQELLASEKDRAENVMIVDLLRNDLSKVCRPGTVDVPALCALMSHPTVHHLESIVTGRLEAGRTAADLLRAAFPGGSITGAPKLRAMEILAELEPVARGVYCGAIGWMSVTGAMDTSIAIRTVTLKDGRAYFHAGGGIVADSDPALEYQETLDKAAGIRHAFEGRAVILLLDNYDSFVWNLARYVKELGREPLVRRNDAISLDEIAALAPSHIIVSPGPCTPAEAGISVDVVRRFGADRPDPRRLPGPPGDRRGLRRAGGARHAPDARQDLGHHARRHRALRRTAEPVPRDALSLARHRAGVTSR